MAKLTSMNREQLNAEAARLGIADADKLEKNADVIAAIEANDTYQAEQEAAAKTQAQQDAVNAQAEAELQSSKPTYIVNGAEVDPNGKPVKGEK